MNGSKRVINFAPGPAKIPAEVLRNIQHELLDYKNTGISVLEMSHRSKSFGEIIATTESNLRKLMSIPSNYKVLMCQGGATGQFAALPMNLIARKDCKMADYVVTGSWSSKAAKEAQKYGKVNLVMPPSKTYTDIPDTEEWVLSPDASYVYLCANETISGVEFNFIPDTKGVPLVCDMSSNIASRPIDVSKFDAIFGSTQKNLGCAGLTVVIIKESLLGHALEMCPSVLSYQVMAENKSLYHTPPTFSIYLMGEYIKWLLEQGGLNAIEERNAAKADIINGIVDKSAGFYRCAVPKPCRSRMNIPVRIYGTGDAADPALEADFLAAATAHGLVELKGHRSVGGLRISLYNAISVEDTRTLADFMEDYVQSRANGQ